MITIEITTIVNRPIDDVFDCLVDISNYSQWMPGHGVFTDCKQMSDGPVSLGSTYVNRSRFGKFLGEVIEFHPPRKVVFRQTLKWFRIPVFAAQHYNTLEAIENSTKVYHKFEGNLFGVFKLNEPIIAWISRGERKRVFSALKNSLEK